MVNHHDPVAAKHQNPGSRSLYRTVENAPMCVSKLLLCQRQNEVSPKGKYKSVPYIHISVQTNTCKDRSLSIAKTDLDVLDENLKVAITVYDRFQIRAILIYYKSHINKSNS